MISPPVTTKKLFARAITIALEKYSPTKTAAAKKGNSERQYYNKIEAGRVGVSSEKIDTIIASLNINHHLFFSIVLSLTDPTQSPPNSPDTPPQKP